MWVKCRKRGRSMNIVKIQTDLLKDALAGKSANWIVNINDAEVIVVCDPVIYIFEPSQFVLDVNKLNVKRDVPAVNNLLDAYELAKPLTITGIKKTIPINGKDVVGLELKSETGLMYVDEAILKNFDKKIDFDGTEYGKPIYIYEGDVLAGVVMPLRTS